MAWYGSRALAIALLVTLTTSLSAQGQNYSGPLRPQAPLRQAQLPARTGQGNAGQRDSGYQQSAPLRGGQTAAPTNGGQLRNGQGYGQRTDQRNVQYNSTINQGSRVNQGSNTNRGGGAIDPSRGRVNQNINQGRGQTPRQDIRGGAAAGSRQPLGQTTRNIPRTTTPPGKAPAPVNRFAISRPDWAERLSKKHKDHLNEILQYWEYKSSSIKTYRCTFQRWEYDTVFGPQRDFKTYSTGELKYSNPDKGLFRIDKVRTYQPPKKPGGTPEYVERADVNGEHWVCDGTHVFDHDFPNKKLFKRELPHEMRGNAISNGPVPFMFGAKRNEILNKYWIRVITPASVRSKPQNQQQFWLEAYPKRAADAANFLKVHVIIDFESFLPQGMVIFDRAYKPPMNESRTVFQFDQRKVNFDKNILNFFMRDFHDVKTPSGWQLVPVPLDGGRRDQAPATAGRGPRNQGGYRR